MTSAAGRPRLPTALAGGGESGGIAFNWQRLPVERGRQPHNILDFRRCLGRLPPCESGIKSRSRFCWSPLSVWRVGR
jgi:hypothetical protein